MPDEKFSGFFEHKEDWITEEIMTRIYCVVLVLLMAALVQCGGDEEVHHREKRGIPTICPDGKFKCPDQTCVNKCDGNPECPGGEDEVDCIHNCTCAVKPQERVKCFASFKGMTAEDCINLGCCWEKRRGETKPNGNGIPFCYSPVGPQIVPKPKYCWPNPIPDDRNNCGWKMIQDHDCQCQGCCCDERIRGTFWCFPPRTQCKKYELTYNGTATTESDRLVGFYSKPITGAVLECPGPDGTGLPVYSIEDPARQVYLYYREATGGYAGAWVFSPFQCIDFNSLKVETNECNPDAKKGGGWIEYTDDWAENTSYLLTCVEYEP